jgi:2-polyprenyl-3-methyl-5-hydroxy-6-metoxy-1,4-benzoquinol methylase
MLVSEFQLLASAAFTGFVLDTGDKLMMDFNKLVGLTQIDRSIDLWDDRAKEVADFFGLTKDKTITIYQQLNVSFEKKPSKNLFSEQDHKSVMMKYDRFNAAYRVITALSRDRKSSDYCGMTIIDYGCGAADYSLMFSVLGAKPIVVDIGGGPVEFASFRMERRGIKHNMISVTPEVEHPHLPKADIINATEVLEHVRNPPALIAIFADSLNPGGYFTFSDYPLKPKTVGGSHLRSAAELRLESNQILEKLFYRIWADENVGYIYKLRD